VDPLTELSLFSGYGGISLGLGLVLPIRPVGYVEIEPYCQQILQSRIRDGVLDDAPIWDDITTFDGKPWRGSVDIISGGFPCQDISCAGKGAGIADGTRSGLWFEMLRVIREIRPRYVLAENVGALLRRGMGIVQEGLAEAGYDTRWTSIRASDVGAPFRGERVFIAAWPRNSQRINGVCTKPVLGEHIFSWCEGIRVPEDLRGRPDIPEPLICRKNDGATRNVVESDIAGNGVVPQQVAQAVVELFGIQPTWKGI